MALVWSSVPDAQTGLTHAMHRIDIKIVMRMRWTFLFVSNNERMDDKKPVNELKTGWMKDGEEERGFLA
jgi:hypothetical protein